ncbi:squalene/phytoene synthase family protein [Desulfobulbus sp. AH-315-M07]|nr:squalene/phytoene synthase family protein [Desulfobulbus sp. AH-315-M07]
MKSSARANPPSQGAPAHGLSAQGKARTEPDPELPKSDPGLYSAADLEFCVALLPSVSRTFALSITVLPDSLRGTIRTAYLLCRIVDTIEDDARLSAANRTRLFDAFDALMGDDRADPRGLERMALDTDLGDGHDRELCLGAGHVFRAFRAQSASHRAAVRPHVEEMSRGMRDYTRRADADGKLRLADMDELEDYCHYVAGTVGKMLTALFELELPDLSDEARAGVRARAISFGLALQMVNIVKDVAEDLTRGDCYLPQSLAEKHGIALEKILEPEHRETGREVIAEVCERARRHLRRAEEYTKLWPMPEGEQVRMFCTVPLTLALATLHEVERGADTLLSGRTPKITRDTVTRIYSDAHHAIKDNRSLEWMLGYYANGAYLRGEEQVVSTPSGCHGQAELARVPTPQHGQAGLAHGTHSFGTHQAVVEIVRPVQPILARPSGSGDGVVLVTGAAGHLGANLVRRLLDDGRSVRVFLRTSSNNSAVEGLDVKRCYGDLRDPESLRAALRGTSQVYHCAAHVSTRHTGGAHAREVFDSNVVGTRNLLRYAGELGVSRVVMTSSFSAVGDHPNDERRPSDEAQPFFPFSPHMPYTRSKLLAEHECYKAALDGLEVVIATSCAILGPADYKPSRMGRVLLDYTHGRLRAYVPGGVEFVAVHDIVEGHILAMDRGRSGQKYVFSTQYLEFDELLQMFGEVTGRPGPVFEVPARVAGAVARVSSWVLDRFAPNYEPRLTPGAIRSLTLRRRADVSKARDELGYRPTDIRDAMYDAYADFARRGLVPPRINIRPSRTVSPVRQRVAVA